MSNAELIKALRKCGKASADRCWDCDYYDREPWCEAALVTDAADALEAAELRIAELEAQIPKHGEWIKIKNDNGTYSCSVGAKMDGDPTQHNDSNVLGALEGKLKSDGN